MDYSPWVHQELDMTEQLSTRSRLILTHCVHKGLPKHCSDVTLGLTYLFVLQLGLSCFCASQPSLLSSVELLHKPSSVGITSGVGPGHVLEQSWETDQPLVKFSIHFLLPTSGVSMCIHTSHKQSAGFP